MSLSGRFRTDLHTSAKSVAPRFLDVDIAGGGPEIYMKSVSGNIAILSRESARGEVPSMKRKSRQERIDILRKLEGGELSVEETLAELN